MRIARAEVVVTGGAVDGARGAEARWTERRGALLYLETPDGIVAQGEASPLPGYSPDTLEDAAARLRVIDWSSLPEPDPCEGALPLLARFDGLARGLGPSARFALETALLDVLARRAKSPLWALLPLRNGGTPVPLSALAGGADDSRSCEAALRAVAEGARTVKLKVRGPDLGAQADVLDRVRRAIGDARLRLDANGTFAARTLARDLSPLVALEPEFLEEPVPTADLAALATPPVPVALDESLQGRAPWSDLAPHFERLRVRAVVLKPTALGGFSACLALADAAALSGLEVTVSHAFEGPVALAAAGQLALAVASRRSASGLSRHAGLGAWPHAEIAGLAGFELGPTDAPGLGVTREVKRA